VKALPAAVALAAALASSGCLVLALHPAYDDAGLTWDPALVGTWYDSDDRVTVTIERGEWRSYRITYEHPIEKGVLTGYLTSVGDAYFLDLSPVRGQDYGSFLLPVHALLRIQRAPDRITVQALDYDRFATASKQGGLVGLPATLDHKQNAVITASTTALRQWLRQPDLEAWFGAGAVFTRKGGNE
jgi:hypothetical protein